MENQSYGKRLWSIWAPLLIKYVIASIVASVCLFLFSGMYMMSQSQSGDIMQLMGQTEEMTRLMLEAADRLMDYAVPMEGAAALVTIPVMLFLMYRDKKKFSKELMIQRKAPLWKYPAIAVISAAMCLGLNNLIILSNISSYSENYEETAEIFYQPSFGIQIICLGILMPVCEELTYRGLMYRRMRKDIKFVQSAVFSSLIFALTHGNLVQIMYGFAMGMMLAYVYEKYGSVLAPVFAHVTANVVSVIGTQFQWFDWIFKDIMHVGAVTVLCAAAASVIYVIMQRMESAFPETGMKMRDENL